MSKEHYDNSFIDSEVKVWLDSTTEAGLCFKKWHADYVVEGLLERHEGDVIIAEGKPFLLTKIGKACFSECEIEGRPCKLATGVAFGKPVAIVKAVCLSEKKGVQKHAVPIVLLKEEWGIDGDAHAGKWHRQVSLLDKESIDKMQESIDESGLKLKLEDGAFGENIVTLGLDLSSLKVGDRITIGEALLELTQIGKECHSDCAIKEAVGMCIMPKKGLFFRVLKGAEVKAGDIIEVI